MALLLLLRFIDRVAQFFTGVKGGDSPRWYRQRLARLRIAAFSLLALANFETAKRDELDFLAFLKRRFDAFQKVVDDVADIALLQLRPFGYCVD